MSHPATLSRRPQLPPRQAGGRRRRPRRHAAGRRGGRGRVRRGAHRPRGDVVTLDTISHEGVLGPGQGPAPVLRVVRRARAQRAAGCRRRCGARRPRRSGSARDHRADRRTRGGAGRRAQGRGARPGAAGALRRDLATGRARARCRGSTPSSSGASPPTSRTSTQGGNISVFTAVRPGARRPARPTAGRRARGLRPGAVHGH